LSKILLSRGPKTASNTITTDDTSRSPLGSTTEQLTLASLPFSDNNSNPLLLPGSRTHGPARALLLNLNRPFVFGLTPTACLRTAFALLLATVFDGSSSDAPDSESDSESRGKPVMDFALTMKQFRDIFFLKKYAWLARGWDLFVFL
jgi:hypothetical protein